MFAHRSITPQGRRGQNVLSRHSLLLLSFLFLLLVGFAGCGDKDGNDVVVEGEILAKVNDSAITSLDYKSGLAKLLVEELPRDENGVPLDMASDAGKTAYLTALINEKILMGEAIRLGFDQESKTAAVRENFFNIAVNKLLWNEAVEKPSENITDEELTAFHAKLGRKRVCRFLITNYEEKALEARERAANGEDWDSLVAEYHKGLMPPSGLGPVTIIYGNTDAYFDEVVFSVEVGEITPPIYTGKGYWILKVDKDSQGVVPDFEANKGTILSMVYRRKVEKVSRQFLREIQKSYKMDINEATLLTAYKGLDPNEMGRDPETGAPKPAKDMTPLAVNSKDMDLPFYSFVVDGKKMEFTLADYKEHFDRMDSHQRPIYAGMLGGLRTSILKQLEQVFLTEEARVRGYYENPEVIREVDSRMTPIIIARLLEKYVPEDENINQALISAQFQNHRDEYQIPEKRDGLLVVCKNKPTASRVGEYLNSGSTWEDIIAKLGTDRQNKANGGRVTYSSTETNPGALSLFSLVEKSQLSKPFPLDDGRFGVVALLDIHGAHQAELAEVSYGIGYRLRKERQANAVNEYINKLRTKVEVEIFQDKLSSMPSYEEIRKLSVPQNVISGN